MAAFAAAALMAPAAMRVEAAEPGDSSSIEWRDREGSKSTSGKSTLRWRNNRRSARSEATEAAREPRLIVADDRAEDAISADDRDVDQPAESAGRIRVEADGTVFRAVYLTDATEEVVAVEEPDAAPASQPLLRSALQPADGGTGEVEVEEPSVTVPRYRQPADADEVPDATEGDLPLPADEEEMEAEPDAGVSPPGRLPSDRRSAPATPLSPEADDDLGMDIEEQIEDCEDDCPELTDKRLFRALDKISLDIRDPLPTRCVKYDPNNHRQSIEDEWTWEEFLKCLSTREADDKARCWTMPDGGRITATFQKYADGELHLKLEDETERTIAWDQVKLKDRRYLMDLPLECPLGDEPFLPRAWCMTSYHWKASCLCHKPLYFEQVQYERYGHTVGPILDPIICGAHFFATLPILPYKMGIEPPNECIYSLGYYRPNSCAPYMIPPFPISLRGAALEAAAVTGFIYAFP
jgi:hypothetical protein